MTTTAGDLVTDAVVSISAGLAAGSALVASGAWLRLLLLAALAKPTFALVDTRDEPVSCIEPWAA